MINEWIKNVDSLKMKVPPEVRKWSEEGFQIDVKDERGFISEDVNYILEFIGPSIVSYYRKGQKQEELKI